MKIKTFVALLNWGPRYVSTTIITWFAALLDDDIRDDTACAVKIFQREGFKYWPLWNTRCKNDDMITKEIYKWVLYYTHIAEWYIMLKNKKYPIRYSALMLVLQDKSKLHVVSYSRQGLSLVRRNQYIISFKIEISIV